MLDMLAGHFHQFGAVPQQAPHGAYIALRPKCRAQQSYRMEKLQPLAFVPVGAPPRHVFHAASVDQTWLHPMLFQHIVERNPPGRRWRTGLPRHWPPSAAQTWCAVFPRHAFTKALASAPQWKESVSQVARELPASVCDFG